MTILEVLNFLQTQYPGSSWTVPPDLKHGVLSTNYAFSQAKIQKTSPVAIATQLVLELGDIIQQQGLPLSVKAVGPYVNVELENSGIKAHLEGWFGGEVSKGQGDSSAMPQNDSSVQGDSKTPRPASQSTPHEGNIESSVSEPPYLGGQGGTLPNKRIKLLSDKKSIHLGGQGGILPNTGVELLPSERSIVLGQGSISLNRIPESFVIDMFHPNVGKKMHVGHIRSANLGESMRRILSLKYDRVISDCYLGDWGIQFSYTTWGILHLPELGLDFDTINIDTEERLVLVDKFYKIYVRMNQLIEEKPEIRIECQQNSKLLEAGMQRASLSQEEQQKFNFLHDLYRKIVSLSLVQFREGEAFLNINQNPSWLQSDRVMLPMEQIERVKGKTGCHYSNSTHTQGQFDLTLGESFYISFLSEMHVLADQGLAVREGKAIYVDLENEKLGRAYLISSEGYSLYHTRDIICRMVYAGIFGFDNAISFVDLRQGHSFKQVFAVLRRIIDSKIYENRAFGWMTVEETQRALRILAKKMAMFEGFGHLNLPDGAMSTRKGKIFAFEDLKSMLLEKVQSTLQEKNSKDSANEDKIRKIAVASLKWVDLHRDREQDSVFDPNQFLKFEGNTGVYQLYTLVRLRSILANNSKKTNPNSPLEGWPKAGVDLNTLNETEILILKQTYTLPLVLENVCASYKPHILCNYLFELATSINSWYAKYSVSAETNEIRKHTLLVFCNFLHSHLEFALSLLGIESVEEI